MRKAFSLAEVLITMGIVGTVIALTFPQMFKGGISFDLILIIVIVVVVFGSSVMEEISKKTVSSRKRNGYQYDYDAKVVKDYWKPIRKLFTDLWQSFLMIFEGPKQTQYNPVEEVSVEK